jgi:hypothetical protein
MPPSKPKRRRLLLRPEEAQAPRHDPRRRAGPSPAVPERRLRRGGAPPEHAGVPRSGIAQHLAAPFAAPTTAGLVRAGPHGGGSRVGHGTRWMAGRWRRMKMRTGEMWYGARGYGIGKISWTEGAVARRSAAPSSGSVSRGQATPTPGENRALVPNPLPNWGWVDPPLSFGSWM